MFVFFITYLCKYFYIHRIVPTVQDYSITYAWMYSIRTYDYNCDPLTTSFSFLFLLSIRSTLLSTLRRKETTRRKTIETNKVFVSPFPTTIEKCQYDKTRQTDCLALNSNNFYLQKINATT